MKLIRLIFNNLYLGLILFAKIILIAMLIIIFVNVVLRYGFNLGIHWSEEIATLLVVWFTFIAMAIGVKQDLHININILPAWLSNRFHKAFDKLKAMIILAFGLIMLFFGLILIEFTSQSVLPATMLPASTMYAILPVAAVLIIYESAMDFLSINKEDKHLDVQLMGDADDA